MTQASAIGMVRNWRQNMISSRWMPRSAASLISADIVASARDRAEPDQQREQRASGGSRLPSAPAIGVGARPSVPAETISRAMHEPDFLLFASDATLVGLAAGRCCWALVALLGERRRMRRKHRRGRLDAVDHASCWRLCGSACCDARWAGSRLACSARASISEMPPATIRRHASIAEWLPHVTSNGRISLCARDHAEQDRRW